MKRTKSWESWKAENLTVEEISEINARVNFMMQLFKLREEKVISQEEYELICAYDDNDESEYLTNLICILNKHGKKLSIVNIE
jgi:uncharacterized protein YjaG (DUF416 family)